MAPADLRNQVLAEGEQDQMADPPSRKGDSKGLSLGSHVPLVDEGGDRDDVEQSQSQRKENAKKQIKVPELGGEAGKAQPEKQEEASHKEGQPNSKTIHHCADRRRNDGPNQVT